jgi:hypothetical protein
MTAGAVATPPPVRSLILTIENALLMVTFLGNFRAIQFWLWSAVQPWLNQA